MHIRAIILGAMALLLGTRKTAAGESGGGIVGIKAPYRDRPWFPHLAAQARKRNIPETVALSMVRQESNGREYAVGASGEIGLFQLKPGVATDYARVTSGAGDIHNPYDNITMGLWYLAWLRDHWNLSLHDALLAYNSGIGNFLNGRIQSPAYATDILERAERWA